MIARPIRYIRISPGRWLVAGSVIIQTALISLFVVDLVMREAGVVDNSRISVAKGIVQMLATSSGRWPLVDDVQHLNELTRSTTALDGLRYAIILSPTGRVLAHSDPEMAGQYITDPMRRSLISGERVAHTVALTSKAIDVAAPILSNSDGSLVGWAWVSLSRDARAETIWISALKGLFCVLFVTLVAITIAWMTVRNITRPLGDLAEVARRFQAGDRKVRARQDRPGEIGVLARGLNNILDTIASSEKAILRREKALAHVQRIARLGGFRRSFTDPVGAWSRETYAIFGHDPALPPPLRAEEWLARIDPQDRERIRSALADRSQDVQSLQFTVVSASGRPRSCWAEFRLIPADGVVVGHQVVCQIGTERENGAAQLRQARSMVSAGQFTGNMAHDFNNLLSVILGNLDFIEDALPERSPALEFSQTALSAALKGAELTQQLLAFSRQQPLSPQAFVLLLENLNRRNWAEMEGRIYAPDTCD